ncbi:hypothetical protein MMC2321_04067 [Chitinophaga sp. MM2321]
MGLLKTNKRVGLTSINHSLMLDTILLAIIKFLNTVTGAL